MGLLDLASRASLWRGYEYYVDGKVLLKKSISDHEFAGTLSGSGNERYDVFIDIEHPRKSHCSCPHANGKRIVCKHQIALYYSFFPKEADHYYQEVVKYAEEEERRQEELEEKVIAYIDSLSKEELRRTLYEVLYAGSDWVFERFVREHIDYDDFDYDDY